MSEQNLLKDRRAHLEKLRALGVNPYPNRYSLTGTVSEIISRFESHSADSLQKEPQTISTAGRITAMRSHGKAAFADISDGAERVQIYVKEDIVKERAFEIFQNCDIGDFAGVSGTLFRTRTGELTIKVDKLEVLSKSLRPLPEKWHGLTDVETRYRQRYLDILTNKDAREALAKRSKLINATREFLDGKNFIEVETPMMHAVPGGATAKPFKTHHEALDLDLYLRIAPELYLKRLLVAGFERVYEINRNFRNEGISNVHNPEFTMLEAYIAYGDYREMMALTEELIADAVEKSAGALDIEYQGEKISFQTPWKRIRFDEALKEHIPGFSDGDIADEKRLKEIAQKNNVDIAGAVGAWETLDELAKHLVEPKLAGPVFLTHLPSVFSPLAKICAEDDRWAERFEVFVRGIEIANAYSEQNDPDVQREAFEAQAKRNPDSRVDEDYLLALEYGMPPATGLGVGIDRLAMIVSNARSIREVIAFPLVRPKYKE